MSHGLSVAGAAGRRLLPAAVLATAAEALWSRAETTLLGRPPVFDPSCLAGRLVRRGTGRQPSPRASTLLGNLMRAGYGPSLAAAFSLALHGRRPRARDALALAGAIWLFELAALPLSGAAPPLRHWSRAEIVLDASNAAIFAATLCLVLRVRGSE